MIKKKREKRRKVSNNSTRKDIKKRMACKENDEKGRKIGDRVKNRTS